MKQDNGACYFCRVLTPADAVSYRELRSMAITGDDKRFFITNPEEELQRTDNQWAAACQETCQDAIIGAFVAEKLVGAISVKVREAPIRHANYSAAFIHPNHRHTQVVEGLSDHLGQWARQHGCVSATFVIRADNVGFLNQQIKHGAILFGYEKRTYADGTHATTYMLVKPITHPNKIREMALS